MVGYPAAVAPGTRLTGCDDRAPLQRDRPRFGSRPNLHLDGQDATSHAGPPRCIRRSRAMPAHPA